MQKTDRRILRTQRYLQEALISLIEEKGYDAVTIRDITDHADVAYATFYRHYDSKNTLLMSVLEKIVQDIEANAGAEPDDYFIAEGRLLFEHIQANLSLYRNLLTSMEVLQSLKQMIIRNIKPRMQIIYEGFDAPKLPFDLLLNHSISTLLSMVSWWLENDMPHSTQEMARYYELLVIQSSWSVIQSDTGPRG